MTQAEHIRRYTTTHYIAPARADGREEVNGGRLPPMPTALALVAPTAASAPSLRGELYDANRGQHYHVYAFDPWTPAAGGVSSLDVLITWEHGPDTPAYMGATLICGATAAQGGGPCRFLRRRSSLEALHRRRCG